MRILTGSQEDAGKDWLADIHVTLVGSQARSDGDQMFSWLELFGHGNQRYDDLILECSESLGQVQVVLLENKATNKQFGMSTLWRCTIFRRPISKSFPATTALDLRTLSPVHLLPVRQTWKIF